MYYYVNGTVAEIDAGLAVIDCSGVGYACATTNYTLSQLKKGAPAKLYTYLNVREDAMELFGRQRHRQKDCSTGDTGTEGQAGTGGSAGRHIR